MKYASRVLLCLAVLLTAWAAVAPPAIAQGATTGALSGLVIAEEGGERLPGAAVEAVHQPTGTRYTSVTRNDGRFTIPNVRVGGPYTVAVSAEGFNTQERTGLVVRLGQTVETRFALELAAIEEVVTVTGEASPIINPSRTGASSNVSEEAIETLPTISRSLEDFARTNPFFSVSPDNSEENQLTVAGRNNRYNNISIDGAVNNDLFGLSASGTPGGQTETTPISLDAIQELQLLVAPYDVRQGGFSGGGVNAITRSGSNRFTGSIFGFTRDDGLVGEGPTFLGDVGTFEDEQFGFRLGGPIVEDRLFFFINGESSTLDEPSGWSIGGRGGQDFGHEAEAERFRNILQTNYGFDPGGFGQQTLATESDKAFGRLDLNIGTAHQLTLRHNFVDADKIFLRPSSFDFEFPSHSHVIDNETNSTVLQINSVLGNKVFNEGRITLQAIEDRRSGRGEDFPFVTVELADGDDLTAGTERFSTRNALDQDILEITNDVTILTGNHTLTVGTHNELFEFDNLFIREAFGAYDFDSLDDLEAGIASEFNHSFSLTDDPNESAEFDVSLLSFYGGDQWAVRNNLTLTYGMRVDIPQYPDTPSRNPATEQFFGLRTDIVASEDPVFSPRLAFNWDPGKDGRSQLRGGAGVFAGRSPFVWISNQYSNTGIEFGRLRVFGDVPFVPDASNQPQSVPGSDLQTTEVDLIDPDFEMPQVLRYNLAYDRQLDFWGLTGSVEVVHSDNIEEIAYKNLVVVPTGETAFDGRPMFDKRLGDEFTDAIFLTNTDRGSQTAASIKIERPFQDGVYGFVSYAYQDASVVNDGTSSQARSNWRFMETTGDPNNLPTSTSDFEVEERFNASLSYNFDVAANLPATVSLFYNAQAGRPYSSTYSFNFRNRASINGDFEFNDLIFVPDSADDVIITNGTFADLERYIEADDGLSAHRGGIVPRNASSAPWIHSLDFRYAQGFTVGRNEFEITFDLLNLVNIFDSDSGVNRFVPFSGVDPVRFEGVDEATGKPIYTLRDEVFDPDERWQVDDIRSRWRARLGLRWSF